MLCPKCKHIIEDQSLKCPNCGTRVGSVCKKCGTYNHIKSTECSNCKKTLIKICSECGAANRPEATSCRKCGIQFVTLENKHILKTEKGLNSQQKAKSKLLDGLKSPEARIITLSGESGIGKNIVLRSSIYELKNAKLTWLLGCCTQTSQLSPFGYFQDLFLTFFNINNFCPDTLQLKKESIKFFKESFTTLNNNEILDLLNFLYPNNVDKYENIYYNKSKMFSILKKVIETIASKSKIIFIVDNFEQIDGMSFDFLKEIFSDESLVNRCKLIITINNNKPGLGLLQTPLLSIENYLDIALSGFSNSQVEEMLKQFTDIKFGKDFINLAIKVSNGNPAIIEQMVLLYKDYKRNGLNINQYNSLDDIINQRLKILKAENTLSYKILIAMSILGPKFHPAILENFNSISYQDFEYSVENLVNLGYITQINSNSFEFKTKEIWKLIVANTKNDESFEEILNSLYDILISYKQSSIALIGYIVQKLNNHDHAFEIWTQLMKQASYIGDIGLYIITQKQALKLIENKTGDFYQKVKKNIYSRVGKLLEPIDYNASFEYLQKAILLLEDDDEALHIELLGYLASCAMKTGNYWGAIECIDNILNKLPESMSKEKTLIKTRQIHPMLRLGNYGQLINTIETEILGELETLLTKGRNTEIMKLSDIFNTWLSVYFDYAEALILQGDCRCFEIIQTIYDIIEKNQVTDPGLICKANLLLAFANTIKGDTNLSKKILDDLLKEYTLDNKDDFVISKWNFIDILNKFFEKDYTTLHTELFNVAAYANNINDSFTKNILKTILAKILKDNNQTKKALEILEEQVAYFAKEKVASGVLLSWYLIAEIKLITNGTQFALDIANKALDIAQSPSINNYYFIALFNKLIGEIYLAKQDFDSAKVYLEKTLFISKQFDLQYIQIKAYLLCARLYQELALPKTNKRSDYVKQALKMFQLAKNVQIVPEHPSIQKNIKEELSILTSFCKLNGIILKRG